MCCNKVIYWPNKKKSRSTLPNVGGWDLHADLLLFPQKDKKYWTACRSPAWTAFTNRKEWMVNAVRENCMCRRTSLVPLLHSDTNILVGLLQFYWLQKSNKVLYLLSSADNVHEIIKLSLFAWLKPIQIIWILAHTVAHERKKRMKSVL